MHMLSDMCGCEWLTVQVHAQDIAQNAVVLHSTAFCRHTAEPTLTCETYK